MFVRIYLLRLLRFIFRTAIGSLIFLGLILSVCLFMFGDLIGWEGFRPLDSLLQRALAVGILWLLILIVISIILMVRARRDRAMSEDIVNGPDEEELTDTAIKSEVAEMRAKMRTAMTALRKSKMGGKSLSQLPWYLMIGPPGAGKTTAIVNSGLQFPLAEEFGRTALGGVGGTRNCDWWFTDNAVMIDTAGRFTTQESDATADSGSWLGFLAMLKKHRPRQPINGAIVALSLSDLSLQDELTQKNQAKAVRRRLQELREKLGVRFPVYIVFTKSDLIAGFSEFFEPLGKEAREQVWGFTLPVARAKGEDQTLARFDEEFDLLMARLNSLSLERMQQETDHQRRSLIAGFPGQVASVRQVARDFLTEIFQENKYEARQFLRGVYFTSGTQEGTPIDRLMMGMARTFGIGRQAIGSGRGQGRSYFLTRLFDGVIFREAGLVSADDKVERRYRWSLRAALTAVVLGAGAIGTVWGQSFLANRDLVARTAAGFDDYEQKSGLLTGAVEDTDLTKVTETLAILRQMPANNAVEVWDSGLTSDWGMDQGPVLADATAQAYHQALIQHLQPRLMLKLEQQLIAMTDDDAGQLYDAFKVYLNLSGIGRPNKELMLEWITRDWETTYQGETYAPLREELSAHLEALIDLGPAKIPMNGDLVALVRTTLRKMDLSERVYRSIINGPDARALPQWSIAAAGGPQVDTAFVRSSGRPLTDGVPGIFTYNGFQVFKDGLKGIRERVNADAWVLDEGETEEVSDEQLALIERNVRALYETEYVRLYEDVLNDVVVRPMGIMSEAVEVTRILGSSSSPIKLLLRSIAEETLLTRQPDVVTAAASEAVENIANAEANSLFMGEMASLMNAARESKAASMVAGSPEAPPGTEVARRFQWLFDLVIPVDEGTPAPIDKLMVVIDAVSKEMTKQQIVGAAATVATPEDSAIVELQLVASEIGGSVQRWAGQIAASSSGISAEGTRASIDARWKSNVLPTCEQVTQNRYPFDKFAPAEVGLTDFAKLFGPGGLIDTFFNENLASLVDTSQRPWVLKPGAGGAEVGLSEAALAQMQYAADIRQAFFPNGPTPQVSFQLSPHSLDGESKSATLEIDGQTIEVDMKNTSPVSINWPGQVGFAQLSFFPAKRGTENSLKVEGPWAWFRLLDSASARETPAEDRLRLYFTVGQRIAIFNLQASTVISPFYLKSISQFACPKSF